MRNLSRPALRLFIPLLLATALNIAPAFADGAGTPLSANQAVTGTVTATGTDSYSFSVTNNKSFVAIVSETGIHDETFLPHVALTGPDNSGMEGTGVYFKDFGPSHPANGSWTVKVSRGNSQSTSGGSYSLTLIQPPFTGATALTGSAQAGSADKAKIDDWTFTGAAGHNVKLTIATTGDAAFAPWLYVFTPTGVLTTTANCNACDVGIDVTESGTWSVAASKATLDGSTGSYTLSVSDDAN